MGTDAPHHVARSAGAGTGTGHRPHEPSRHRMRIHVVREHDWASHRDLRLEMLTTSPDAFWLTLDEVTGRTPQQWRDAVSGSALFLQARDATGTAHGTVGVLPEGYDASLPIDDDTVNVVALYVRPGARGHGLVDLLLDATAVLTRELGRSSQLLEVASSNTAAIRVYRRHGFTFTGATTPHPRRAELVEREMRRRLPG